MIDQAITRMKQKRTLSDWYYVHFIYVDRGVKEVLWSLKEHASTPIWGFRSNNFNFQESLRFVFEVIIVVSLFAYIIKHILSFL